MDVFRKIINIHYQCSRTNQYKIIEEKMKPSECFENRFENSAVKLPSCAITQ